MLRSFFLLFSLFTLSVHATSDADILKRASGFVKSHDKSKQFRAYNDYKNLYLRALMRDDKNLRKKSLQGIVKSGHLLHIDISQYADELQSLTPVSHYNKPKSKSSFKKKKNKKIQLKASHKLKSIHWYDGRLVLKFDKKLRKNQVNYFTLYDSKAKRYRYVFDINAMLSSAQTLRKQGINKIKIAQFNPTTLRLVIENRSKVRVRFRFELSKLIINLQPTNKHYALQPTQPTRVDRNKIIVIDAGHGGKDPGATGYRGYREKIVVFQIATKLRNILKARGYRVYMTRSRDKFKKLRWRTKFANRKKADLFISIHANAVGRKSASKVQGIECYFLSPTRSSRAKRVAAKENSSDLSNVGYFGKETFLNTLNSHNIIASNKLAIDLQRGMLASLRKKYKGVKDAGVREGPFWVLVGAQMPSVLIEVGFITHPKEARRLVDKRYQQTMAEGMANGVERYFINN